MGVYVCSKESIHFFNCVQVNINSFSCVLRVVRVFIVANVMCFFFQHFKKFWIPRAKDIDCFSRFCCCWFSCELFNNSNWQIESSRKWPTGLFFYQHHIETNVWKWVASRLFWFVLCVCVFVSVIVRKYFEYTWNNELDEIVVHTLHRDGDDIHISYKRDKRKEK